jgi:glycosyltransferase involved in cell wall biosynthesis
VQSILKQTYKNFEFLIVDDGSTDDSLTILNRYTTQDTRIKLISRPNTGYIKALNEMLERSEGEFIARMDADDISDCRRFEIQLEKMRSNPNLVAVGTKLMLVDPENNDLYSPPTPLDHDSIDRQNLKGVGLAICHPSVMFRRKAAFRVGAYNERFYPAEDVDFFLRLAEIGDLENIDYIGIRYRLHRQSVGHKHRTSQIQAAYESALAAMGRRKLPPSPPHAPENETVFRQQAYTVVWAWWALQGKNFRTARRYAILSLLACPWDLDRWKLLACCIRKR